MIGTDHCGCRCFDWFRSVQFQEIVAVVVVVVVVVLFADFLVRQAPLSFGSCHSTGSDQPYSDSHPQPLSISVGESDDAIAWC